MEIWKEIKNYEGLYEISNLGNVKKLKREVITKNGVIKRYKEKIMAQTSFEGHKHASLTKEGKKRRLKIARLVAAAFIENPLNKPIIQHKNFNRKDNSAENLEWTSSKDISEKFKNKTNRC